MTPPLWFDRLLVLCFRVHDWGADTVARHLRELKMLILAGAHLALFGFFFPELRKDFGELAANLLIFILFLSPLSQIFRARLLLLLMSLRRELGITMAYLASVHGLGYLLDPLSRMAIFGNPLPGQLLDIAPPLLLGLGAYALTLPLLFTSNNFANRKLGGKNWKRLHRIVYAVFTLAILHRFLIRGGDAWNLVQVGALIGSYAALKLLVWRNFLPPLERLITLTSVRYAAYQMTRRSALEDVSIKLW